MRPLALFALLPACGGPAAETGDTAPPDVAPGLDVYTPRVGELFAAGEAVVVTGVTTDDRDDATALSVVVAHSDGELLTEYPATPDAAGAFSVEIAIGEGDHTLTISSCDTAGNCALVDLAFQVGGGGGDDPPSAPEIYVEPTTAMSYDALTVGFTTPAVDPEGAAVGYRYAWTLDGAPFAETAAIDGTAVFRGQEWAVEVWPSDGGQEGPSGTASLTIANAPPSASNVTVGPGDATPDDDLTCTVNGVEDREDDPITFSYAWTVAGEPVAGVGATLPAGNFGYEQEIVCTVTLDDGYDAVTFTSWSFLLWEETPWRGYERATDADVTIDGVEADGAFGKTIALLGDADGDGLSELAVGASGEGGEDGAVYLFAGTDLSGSITTADAVGSWEGAWTGGKLGGYRSLAAPGDLDGDGAADLLFAAADADTDGVDASGEAYLVYGGSPALGADPTDADWRVTSEEGGQAGARLGAVDLDGDGWTDLLVAAPGADDGGTAAGLVGVFHGDGTRLSGATSVQDADWAIVGDAAGDGLGWTTKGAGDVDGDGYDELVVTAMYADAGGSESGQVGLVQGGTRRSGQDTLTDAAMTVFTGDAAGDRLGYDALGGMDFDDDGVGDLLLGAYQDDAGAADAGTVYCFLGHAGWASAHTPADAIASIEGTTSTARFGHVMAAPGDLDSDGRGDVLIGALFDSPTGLSNQGATYLLVAGDWGYTDDDLDWRAYGEEEDDLFGDALSVGSGDVDGDGGADFAVGAQGNDSGGSDAGRVYLWWGR